MKGGAIIEFNGHNLYESFHKSDLKMDLAMQIISSVKTVRNDIIQGLKDFHSQSLKTQARKGEQLVSLVPAIKNAFDLMGDDTVDSSPEN